MVSQHKSPTNPISYRLLSVMVALTILLGLTGWKLHQQALAYETQTLLIVDQLQAEAKLESQGKKLLQVLSFGTYQGYDEEIEQLNQLKQRQLAYRQSVVILSLLFLTFSILFIICSWLLRKHTADVAYALTTVAILSLALGLTIPILSIQTSQQLPLLGETLLQYQSKGVISSIVSLGQQGNTGIAVLLFIFSVFLPIAKTGLVFLTLFARTHHLSIKGLHLSRNIGKWSMADVFVIAILVVYFSSDNDTLIRSNIGPGLWFFAAYVLLSLVGTQLIYRHLHPSER